MCSSLYGVSHTSTAYSQFLVASFSSSNANSACFWTLLFLLDVFSRKVVGWAFGQRQTADLVLAALNMALQTRRARGVIHHSDQGSQYTSLDFSKHSTQMGVCPSMGSVVDAYDNAMAERFFAGLECELIDRRVWKTFAQARMDHFTWGGLVQPAPASPRHRAALADELREGTAGRSRPTICRHRRVTQRVLCTCGQAASGPHETAVGSEPKIASVCAASRAVPPQNLP